MNGFPFIASSENDRPKTATVSNRASDSGPAAVISLQFYRFT